MTEGQGASHIVEGRQAEGSRGPCHREPVTGAQGQQVPSQQGEQGGRTETRQRLRGGLHSTDAPVCVGGLAPPWTIPAGRHPAARGSSPTFGSDFSTTRETSASLAGARRESHKVNHLKANIENHYKLVNLEGRKVP